MTVSRSNTLRRFLIPLLCVLMLLSFAGAALAEVVGRLTRIEGAVDIMPGGKLPAVAARQGGNVEKGDFVRTKSNSRAEITFNDGSMIKIAQRSRIDVSEYSGSTRKLGLPRGKVQASVIPAAAGGSQQSFEIRTPNAIAGVRGTSFYVYHQSNITGVAVSEGMVHTASLDRPKQGVLVGAGFGTTVARGQAPAPPRPVTEREMGGHRDDVTPVGNTSGNGGAPSDTEEASSGASSTSGSAMASGSEPAPLSEQTASTSGEQTSTDVASTETGNQASSTDAPSSTTGSGDPSQTAFLDPSIASSQLGESLNEAINSPTNFTPEGFTTPADGPTEPAPKITPPVTEDSEEYQHEASTPPDGSGGTYTPPGGTTGGTTSPPGGTTPPPPAQTFVSLVGAGLMSRDETIDTSSNLLTIVSDPGLALTLSGTTSLWTGSAVATLTGAYPSLPLLQPNHYWFGKFHSGSTANHTTADGGAYFGYFGGMSLDGSGASNTNLSAIYIDPAGKTGIMQGTLPGTVSAGTLTASGPLTLTEMAPISSLSPAAFGANWWNSSTGTTIVERTGAVMTGGNSFSFPRNEAEGFMLDSAFNITSEMTDRGDVLRVAGLSSDPSFGIWTRESFGTYDPANATSKFVLASNAQWGTQNADFTFNTSDEFKIISVGDWQSGGSLSGIATGVWGHLDTGSIKLLTGVLTGSSNSAVPTFGAVSTGSYLDLSRFLSNPTLAAQFGFPTIKGAEFSLSGATATGNLNIGNVTFYSHNPGDPVSLWVAGNVSGSYSGDLMQQNYSLMNGTTGADSTILGSAHVNARNETTKTWLGYLEAIGQNGTDGGTGPNSAMRSEFDGIMAGTYDDATGTFTGTAAGLSHPVTYFSSINGGVTRYFSGGSVSYGNLDGIMGGMSLWNSGQDMMPSEFRSIGFFTPNQTLTESDFVFSVGLKSKDVPTGSAMTADGGAYQGHLVAGMNTNNGSFSGIEGTVNALYVDPTGAVGIMHGNVAGNGVDPDTKLFMADGALHTVKMADQLSGVTASNFNSGAVATDAFAFGSGTYFGGAMSLFSHATDTFSRSYIAAAPDWGIGHFGLYSAYSVAPSTATPWNIDFNITDSTQNFKISGMMADGTWNQGSLSAQARAGWHDLHLGNLAAAPSTGIFIGETVGTYNPASLQAMTSGIWMETSKFLDMVAVDPGTLEKLNIPAVEVGRTSFTGTGANYNVTINDVRFFAPVTGGRAEIFATDSILGNFSIPNPGGSVILSEVVGAGGPTGLTPTFFIGTWDTTNSKWSGSLTYNGTAGVVGGETNIQLMGTAAGTFTGASTGTFNGTAAGVVR